VKSKVACVIPAAGWGSVCPVRSTPKVLAEVESELMICRIIKSVIQADFADSLIVVVGREQPYGGLIREALSGYTDLQLVTQPERRGAADAVACALPHLNGEEHVFVTFGDMPLWRPYTFRGLVRGHLQSAPSISMVTLRLQEGHRTERYGRIVRDGEGRILAALEPFELDSVDLIGAQFVNPSLYVFEREWLVRNLPLIPPTDKGDGFSPELHLPKLLPIAHAEGVEILELPLEDPSEALGVNTPDELIEVQAALRTRNGNG